jgi:glycosyltransferase involved in cell wall biosynthesis
MRIILLSFYFEPDFGPAAIRNSLIARSLARHESVESVDVITTMPNRWVDQHDAFSPVSREDKLTIHRVKVGAHQHGVFDQARAYATYAAQARKIINGMRCDLVYASSSRLATSLLATYISKQKNALFYLDIRDLFIETIRDYYAKSAFKLLLPALSQANAYAIRSADRINVLSEAFIEHIKTLNADADISTIFNGVDPEFCLPNTQADDQPKASRTHKEILYAGNIGFGQALEKIVPTIAKDLPPEWKITIIGSGKHKPVLKQRIAGLKNVKLADPIDRVELPERYQSADILMLHLNDQSAFAKSLPSKFFEYVASNKPILAGAQGYLRQFVDDNEIEGVYFFTPNDSASFSAALGQVRAPIFDRSAFTSKWARETKIAEMTDDIVSLYTLKKTKTH